MTGFNLPPGCSTSDIDRACDGPCAVCGASELECICPECPVCGMMGDPHCYADLHGYRLEGVPDHGLTRTPEQIESLRKFEAMWADEASSGSEWDRRIADHVDGYDRDDLGESPDY